MQSIHWMRLETVNKKIRIVAYQDSTHGILEIHDNGEGIDEDISDKIYDPLFTTKKF